MKVFENLEVWNFSIGGGREGSSEDSWCLCGIVVREWRSFFYNDFDFFIF